MATKVDRAEKEKLLAQQTASDLDKSKSGPATVGDDRAVERANSTLDQLEQIEGRLAEELANDIATDVATGLAADGALDGKLGYELPVGFCLSIVVPIYNEERTIERVISSLFALPLPVEVIAVDDGSTDGTCALLTKLNTQYPPLRVVFQESNQGKGAALRLGFSMATGSHIMVQDADLEYNPEDIPKLVEPLAKDEADVVYGSRFLEDNHKGSSFIHRFGNGVLTKASNYITGWDLTDMETCYKVMRRSLIQDMTLEQNGFGFEVELTAKLANVGARVVERPISYDARGWEDGKKIGWKDAVQAIYCICRYR